MAATAARQPNGSPQTNSRMSSPKDSKKTITPVTKAEEPTKVETSSQEQQPSSEESKPSEAQSTTQTTNSQPLAPPPRPTAPNDTPDYFNTVHNPFSLEPNVFEQSFGNPSLETPGGRTILPPVANITSPSPLPGITPGWQSLRSGPLSPAMLTGPTGQSDYFSESFRGFPTPNESSLRTGLTPGGGGSMFPAPSPNTQAIFNLQSGGVTPSTADFQQSALRAAAVANQNKLPVTSAPTSQPEPAQAVMDRHNYQQQQQQQKQDPYANHGHDVSNAANDLLSFATQNGTRNGVQPFAMPNQPQQQMNNMGHMPVQPVAQENGRRATKGSINSISGSAGTGEFSDSGQSEQRKTTRSRAGKKGAANGKQSGKRKASEDTPKGGNKKAKSAHEDEDGDSDEDTSPKPEGGESGRKMTDEEKRKNFLERNRVAALKCRQRKKQWLTNLQAKVEIYSTENDALTATVGQLREEVVNLKTLLLAHKDCPVSHAQGLAGMNMNTFLGGELGNHQNPYGIAQMQPGMGMGVPQQGPR